MIMFRNTMHFKSRMWSFISCLFIALFFVISPIAAAEKPIGLKFSAFYPENNPAGPITKEFCHRLEEASGGRIKIDIYWAGALGAAKEQLEVVRGGLGDLALYYPVYDPIRFPLTLFVELPLQASKGWIATKTASELIKTNLITDEFKKADVELLAAIVWPPSKLSSNKKITRVEDFKGLRVWSSGPVMAKTLSLLGASGITLTWADIYMGLDRGTLDAFPGSWTSSAAIKTHEVSKYGVDLGLMGGYMGTLIMNKNSWNKIPPDVQTKLRWENLGREFSERWAKILDEKEEEAKQVWVKQGRELIAFPQEEKEKLANKIVEVWQDWMQRNEAGGRGELAKKVYKTYVESMKKTGDPVSVKLPGLYE
jgi:TRAP-type C4-dicarboxylate transport system substrate-binding protein